MDRVEAAMGKCMALYTGDQTCDDMRAASYPIEALLVAFTQSQSSFLDLIILVQPDERFDVGAHLSIGVQSLRRESGRYISLHGVSDGRYRRKHHGRGIDTHLISEILKLLPRQHRSPLGVRRRVDVYQRRSNLFADNLGF